MKQILTFAVILLAMLSMVNAFPLVKREQCPGYPSPPTLTVTIDPNPVIQGKVEAITVSGTLSKDITEEYKLITSLNDMDGDPIVPATIVDICTSKDVKCPIKAGTPFEIKEEVAMPPQLPKQLQIGVSVASLTIPIDIIGCSLIPVDVQ